MKNVLSNLRTLGAQFFFYVLPSNARQASLAVSKKLELNCQVLPMRIFHHFESDWCYEKTGFFIMSPFVFVYQEVHCSVETCLQYLRKKSFCNKKKRISQVFQFHTISMWQIFIDKTNSIDTIDAVNTELNVATTLWSYILLHQINQSLMLH